MHIFCVICASILNNIFNIIKLFFSSFPTQGPGRVRRFAFNYTSCFNKRLEIGLFRALKGKFKKKRYDSIITQKKWMLVLLHTKKD